MVAILRELLGVCYGKFGIAYHVPSFGRASIAHRTKEDSETEAVAGVAIWASVSEAVDAAVTGQVKAGVFPAPLKPEDWTSGETVWLLDVLAGDRRTATSAPANFRQVAGERAVKIHPVVARGVEEGVLERMVKAREVAGA